VMAMDNHPANLKILERFSTIFRFFFNALEFHNTPFIPY
jgi:hypothetical protein